MVLLTAFVAAWCAAAAVLLRRGSAVDQGNARAQAWFARASALAAVMLSVAAVVRAGGHGSVGWAAVGSVGTIAAGACAYQGLMHLHRRPSATARTGDWSNGLASVLALIGAGNAIAGRSATSADWFAQAWIVQVAVWLVVLGSATSLLALTGLARHLRTWLVLTVLWLLVAGDIGAAASTLRTSASLLAEVGTGPIMPLAWAGCVTAAVIAIRRPAMGVEREVNASSTAGGATVIVACSLAIIVADVVAHGRPTPVTVVACAIAGTLGLARLGTLVRELAHLATSRVEARTDVLTGLVNRRGFLEVLATACDEGGAGVAILDMDGFKEVNDTFGHAGGDVCIAALAARLDAAIPPGVVLARIGGDEFAAVVPACNDLDAVALALLTAAHEPVVVQGRTLVLDASAGLAAGGRSEVGADELMRRADTAMYVAKRSGGGLRAYDEQLDLATRARQQLLKDLRGMLADTRGDGEHGSLVVHYQPQLDLASGAVSGAEALVRWEHPRLGLLAPGVFLPLVEEHAMTMELTARVLSLATRDAASWPADLAVSVNVSAADLADPQAVAAVRAALAASGLAPARLTIEVTETMLLRDPAASSALMQQLRPSGIRFSLDDYGTGYSTLALLKDLPVDELKIDRSFVAQLTQDTRTRAIVAGTIHVAHDLGMTVVGEGVEDDATLDALRAIGCDLSQGFLHATPLPEPVFRAWTARRLTYAGPLSTLGTSWPGAVVGGR